MTEMIRINDTTWRIENGFVRMFLLAGSEKALLIDTGASCPEAKELAESLTDKPVSLLYTHADGDHTSGTAAFAEYMMHPADYENCNMAAKFPENVLIPVYGGEVIDLGGRQISLVHIPGHTQGSIAIIDDNTRALISGDSVQDGHIYMFGAHRRPAEFAAAMDKLIAVEDRFDVIWPSHGAPELPAGHVRKVAAAWKKVQNGEITPHEQDMHGNTVLAYDAGDCGFYCDKV